MITTAIIISVVFRLINFGVIVGLITYLFMYRVLPAIYDKIKERNAEVVALHEQQESLVERHKQLLQQLQQDEKTATILKNRIDRWHQVITQEAAKREAEKQQQREHVQKQIEIKEYERMRIKAYDKTTRAAITQVQHKITQQLSDQKTNQAFFEHLINSMAMREK